MAEKKFTIQETAAELGMPVLEVQRIIREGKLATTLLNGVEYITVEEIESFRKAYTGPPGTNL